MGKVILKNQTFSEIDIKNSKQVESIIKSLKLFMRITGKVLIKLIHLLNYQFI